MLPKHLSIVSITNILCSILTTNTFQIATASQNSVASIDRDKLTVKPKKETSTNIDRQSEVASIHHTLTQLYRGQNECNVNIVSKYKLWSHPRHRQEFEYWCNQVRLGNAIINCEVKSIELTYLSGNKARVLIDDIRTYKIGSMQQIEIDNRSYLLELHKVNGRWVTYSSPV
jgi:hypothetical protein